MIQERYRRDYDGEFILIETLLANNRIRQRREWIDNPVKNDHISGRAAVIGDPLQYGKFTHRRLENHRGGLLATKSLQTYGTNDLWRDMRFDFFLTNRESEAKDIITSSYHEDTVVYSNLKLCVQNPGCFYPVPYQPVLDAVAQLVYLAAFDGHKEIFLLGYHSAMPVGTANWVNDVNSVLKTYKEVKFYLITQNSFPNAWLNNDNVEHMEVRKFISYCDV